MIFKEKYIRQNKDQVSERLRDSKLKYCDSPFIPNQNKTREYLKDFRILRILDLILYQVISNYFKYKFDIKARFDCKLIVAFFI